MAHIAEMPIVRSMHGYVFCEYALTFQKTHFHPYLVQLLEHEARLIPDGFELPFAKKEVERCMCVMDRIQLRSERAYEVARDACCPTKSGVRQAWSM